MFRIALCCSPTIKNGAAVSVYKSHICLFGSLSHAAALDVLVVSAKCAR